jgi:hypothetical protein
MPHDFAESRPMRARHLAPLTLRVPFLCVPLLCMTLAACSSGGDSMTFLANPGKYEYHNCEQLSGIRKYVAARQKELKELIEQAERGAGGVLVGAVVYRSDYVAQTEELRVIDATARDKDCLTTATWRSNKEIH